jgi:hypothetical protein
MIKSDLKTNVCAAMDCEEIGIHYLKVIHLNKVGWFCDVCKDNLIMDRLVEPVQGESVRHER